MNTEREVKGRKGSYHIASHLVKRQDGGVDIDVIIDIIVRNIENDKLVKRQRFALPQNSSNRELESLLDSFENQAKVDFS